MNIRIFANLAIALFPMNIIAEEISHIIVYGESIDEINTGESVTQGIIFKEQLDLRPITRTAELLEYTPGLVATQHSSEGKANQYYLRGFNLDHGTDFSITVEGMPVNMPTHAHGHGYSDINFIIPEVIEYLEFRKGPYFSDIGDFSLAGSASFHYTDEIESQVKVGFGEDNYQRIFFGDTLWGEAGKLLVAMDYQKYDGPWEINQNLDKLNLIAKYTINNDSNSFSTTFMSYKGDWRAPDQVPERAVKSGFISRYGSIDKSLHGNSERNSISFSGFNKFNIWDIYYSAYFTKYKMDLFSNFTYFLNDPIEGDQFEQFDDRDIMGLDVKLHNKFRLFEIDQKITLGFQSRFDDINDIGLYAAKLGNRSSTIREDKINQEQNSIFLSWSQDWSDDLVTTLGLRYDLYNFKVKSDMDANSGNTDDEILSPKLSVRYQVNDFNTVYFNYGIGFHSNDARGTVISSDPADPNILSQHVDPIVKGESWDIGLKNDFTERLTFTLSYFEISIDSELLYVGDAGNTEENLASIRKGVEFSSVFRLNDYLNLDYNYTHTDAQFDIAVDNKIPNSIKNTSSFGIVLSGWENFSGGLRARYLGRTPLNESGEVYSDSSFILNFGCNYKVNSSLNLGLNINNILDSSDNDISYLYESKLKNEQNPIEDIHYHPVEPRSFRFNINYIL
ncbi:TonB-dependent receptor [Microbulbifer sp. CnH-101-G]|uniref:TonB-dependent receptor n=1 Tax=Microbulbifer sp. CnH-101-G TaxID=3243393 RepID=UPI00403A0D23